MGTIAEDLGSASVVEYFAPYIELAFCPTGKGGGVDASCPPANKGTGAGHAPLSAEKTAVLTKQRDIIKGAIKELKENGLAYIDVGGKKYSLGQLKKERAKLNKQIEEETLKFKKELEASKQEIIEEDEELGEEDPDLPSGTELITPKPESLKLDAPEVTLGIQKAKVVAAIKKLKASGEKTVELDGVQYTVSQLKKQRADLNVKIQAIKEGKYNKQLDTLDKTLKEQVDDDAPVTEKMLADAKAEIEKWGVPMLKQEPGAYENWLAAQKKHVELEEKLKQQVKDTHVLDKTTQAGVAVKYDENGFVSESCCLEESFKLSSATWKNYYNEQSSYISELHSSERDALVYYKGSGAFYINAELRGTSGKTGFTGGKPAGLNGPRAKTIMALDKIIANAVPVAKDMNVMRGVAGVEFLAKLKTGDVYEDPGFVSTTVSKEIAADFGSGKHSCILRIKVPKGTKAIVGVKSEKELILGRNTRFRVTGVRSESGYYTGYTKRIMDVEVIP